MSAHPATNRVFVFACLMAAMFMVAIEATVVATAMPQIVAKLGGFSYYSWVFSGFLLAQSATTVMFGKLADLFGRKPVMIAGLAVFLLGSILAGFSWSMTSLIGFRLLQGLGAGAIQPTSMTIVSDLFTFEERRKTQAYMASVWAVSAIIGPLAGALIVQHISWSWVFWVNIPLGIAAIVGLCVSLHERVEHVGRSIDYLGAGLFTLGVTALLLAISPPEHAGLFSQSLFYGAIFIVAAPAFFWVEARSPSPMVALGLWAEPVVASANAATLAAGLALIGLTACLPIYIQAVLGRSPVVSGVTLTAMAFGWPVGSTLGARLMMPKIGMRNTFRWGAVLFLVGSLAFPFLNPRNGVWLSGLGSLAIGVGMGMISYASIMLIQSTTAWNQRGAATASNVFSRLLGNTLGAAAMGAIINLGLRMSGANVSPDQIKGLMERGPGAAAGFNPVLHAALGASLHWVFVSMLVLAVITLMAAWTMPHRAMGDVGERGGGEQPEAAG